MKRIGYKVIDMIVDHLDSLREKPVTNFGSRTEMENLLREPIPLNGMSADMLLDEVEKKILNKTMFLNHPRFFAFIPSPSNFISMIADCMVSAFNPFAGTWLESSSSAEIELITIDWLKKILDLPPTAGGIFVSGGSTANLLGLEVAKNVKLNNRVDKSVIYFADQTHSSVKRALKIIGFNEENIHKISSTENYTLSIEELIDSIILDKKRGLKPFCIIANAGSTNTGSIDPLIDLYNISRKEDMWLHVDGAYGAAAYLTPNGKELLNGMNLADSLTIDPHKWWFQPYETSCIFVREAHFMKDTFQILPEYLRDHDREGEEVNFCDYGHQLTRRFRALKLWMSFKYFGLKAFRNAILKGIHLAEYAESFVKSKSELELITPAQLGILTFRFIRKNIKINGLNKINSEIINRLVKDGYAMISSTVLGNKVVLRMCIINPRTTESDIDNTINRIVELGENI